MVETGRLLQYDDGDSVIGRPNITKACYVTYDDVVEWMFWGESSR